MRMSLSFRTMTSAVALASALFAFATAPVDAQTMQETLAAAYRSNPSLLAERARLRATDELVARALSGWRPTIQIQTEGGKARDEIDVQSTTGGPTIETERRRTPFQAQFTIRQPLYRGGRTVAETQRAENLVQRGRATLRQTEQTVLFEAGSAHANLLRDQAVLDLNINNEQVLQRQLDAARDRFRVGEITRTDVSQAESRRARARADRILAEGNVTSTRANYQRVIGEAPGRLQPSQLPPNLPGTEGEAQSRAGSDNPALVSAIYNERAALNDVDLVFGELLPTLNLNSTTQRSHETQTRGQTRDSIDLTAALTVPLYQAGSVDARVREAKQTAGARRIEIEDARRRAREDTTRAWEALTTARAAMQAIDAQIRAAEIALDGVEQEARVGSRTVLDVLDAEQELLNGKVSLVRAQRDEIVAAHQLQVATGQLSAKELGLPVDLYDPVDNYNRTRNRWIGTSVAGEDEVRAPR
jgi:TolC family type I secretion outer membrane protein